MLDLTTNQWKIVIEALNTRLSKLGQNIRHAHKKNKLDLKSSCIRERDEVENLRNMILDATGIEGTPRFYKDQLAD